MEAERTKINEIASACIIKAARQVTHGANEEDVVLQVPSADVVKPRFFMTRLHCGSPDMARLPIEDMQAWKIILYWTHEGVLPREHMLNGSALTHRCWNLSQRLNLRVFQDEMVKSLLVDPAVSAVRPLTSNVTISATADAEKQFSTSATDDGIEQSASDQRVGHALHHLVDEYLFVWRVLAYYFLALLLPYHCKHCGTQRRGSRFRTAARCLAPKRLVWH